MGETLRKNITNNLFLAGLQQEGDPAPKIASPSYIAAGPKDSSSTTSTGLFLYGLVLFGGVIAFAVYQFLQANERK